jgi:hypothetical protein
LNELCNMTEPNVPTEIILDLLEEQDANVRERYQKFRETELADDEIKMTALDRIGSGEEKELFPFLLNTEIGIQQFQARNFELIPMDFLYSTGLCFFISTLEDNTIVSPDGEELEKSLSDLYGTEIISDPEDFWNVYYEMEVANTLVTGGLEAYPIDETAVEGNGADVLLKENGTEFWVECKNKRKSTPYEWDLEKLSKEVADSAWRDHDLRSEIGEDSFAVKISGSEDFSDEILNDQQNRQKFIELASEKLSSLIENRESDTKMEFKEFSLEIELIDYYEGRYKVKLEPEQMEALNNRGKVEKVVNPFQHLKFNPDVLDGNGHAYPYMEKTDNGEAVEIFNACAFVLDIPWDIPYHRWVYSTIKDVRKQHSDHSNLIIFTKIPTGVVKQMMREDASEPNHNGDIVKKWERLEEKIIGIFGQTDRVKAVVLTTDIVQVRGKSQNLRNPVKTIYNRNVKEQIPDKLVEILDDKPQIENTIRNAKLDGIPKER